MGTLREDLHGMRNFLDESCTENQNTHFNGFSGLGVACCL